VPAADHESPEVSGPIDADNKAHEMADVRIRRHEKGRTQRIKIGVRTAMSAPAASSGPSTR